MAICCLDQHTDCILTQHSKMVTFGVMMCTMVNVRCTVGTFVHPAFHVVFDLGVDLDHLPESIRVKVSTSAISCLRVLEASMMSSGMAGYLMQGYQSWGMVAVSIRESAPRAAQ